MKPIGLVPVFYCLDFKESLAFYTEVLGFRIRYERPEESFAYLERGNAHIMIEQLGTEPQWITAKPEYPFGRGINFQIEVDDVHALYATIEQKQVPIFAPLEEKWYRKGSVRVGQTQFLVQDPSGYLLRFYQDLGEKEVIGDREPTLVKIRGLFKLFI